MPDNIPELPADFANWTANVPAIKTSDRLLGDTPEDAGISGPLNLGREALALRTSWLKVQVDALLVLLNGGLDGYTTDAELAAAIADFATNAALTAATANLVTTADLATAIADLVAAAPGTLDTLDELATALGDDPDFAATMTALIGTKFNSAGGTIAGALDVSVEAHPAITHTRGVHSFDFGVFSDGSAVPFRIDGLLVAKMYPSGTSAPTSVALMTREKCDDRYPQLSGFDLYDPNGTGLYKYGRDSGQNFHMHGDAAGNQITSNSLFANPKDFSIFAHIDGVGFRYQFHSDQALMEIDGVPVVTQTSGDARYSKSGTLIVRDEKANGTNAQGLTAGVYVTREFNTVEKNTLTGASLTGNQITLPAGDREWDISVPAFQVNIHRAVLYDVTNGVVLDEGTHENSHQNAMATSSSRIIGGKTLATPIVVEVRHICQTTIATGGGDGRIITNDTEPHVFTVAKFW